MKKLSYIFIFSILFSMFINVSCGEEFRGEDLEFPKISNIRFNLNDSIKLTHPVTNKDTMIYFNAVDKDLLQEFDTLVIGHKITLSGYLSDDQGLSSVIVRLWGDTAIEKNLTDTCYRLRIVPTLSMFGEKDCKIDNFQMYKEIPSKLLSSDPNRENRNLPVRLGAEEYFFSVRCIDIVGNETLVIEYDDIPEPMEKQRFVLLSEDSIKNTWIKRLEKKE